MPNYYLLVLYKHIIQVENKNLGLKVGGHMPPLPPASYASVYIYIYTHIYIYIYNFSQSEDILNILETDPVIVTTSDLRMLLIGRKRRLPCRVFCVRPRGHCTQPIRCQQTTNTSTFSLVGMVMFIFLFFYF